MKQSVFVLLFALAAVTPAQATLITHEFTNVAGDTWQANYTVSNDTLADAIIEITIWYELGVYDNIAAIATPADWDPLVADPDPFIPDDGFYDAFALGAPLAPGETLGGFVVEFDLPGGGQPFSHFYEIYDATFAVVDSGFTAPVVVTDPNTIPEPATALLVLLGCAGIRARRSTVTGAAA